MILWRAQFGDCKDGFDFNYGGGACGKGIYAMLENDKPMRRYYTARGEKLYSFEVPDNLVKEVKGKGLTTYWSLKERIYSLKEEGFKVFVCRHKGIGIPTSKQILITDAAIITNVKLV